MQREAWGRSKEAHLTRLQLLWMPNDTPANVSGTGEETQETPHTGGEDTHTHIYTYPRGRAQWHLPRWLQRPNAQITSYITAYADTETHRKRVSLCIGSRCALRVGMGSIQWAQSTMRSLFKQGDNLESDILAWVSLSSANLITLHQSFMIPSLKDGWIAHFWKRRAWC